MKNIILTGASDGLGKEFALKCLQEKDNQNIINKANIEDIYRFKDYDEMLNYIKNELEDS